MGNTYISQRFFEITTLTYGATGRYIKYTYNADGTLIRKQAFDNNTLGTTTDYVDGFVYVNNTLSYFPIPEGRVLYNAGAFNQEFVITDQQGNARFSFQNNSGAVLIKQENSFYGFGMAMLVSTVTTPTTPNKRLYNGGSEWQNDYSNLPDYYQTFYRNYDAALGRWIGVDPVAESAESMTSYQYAGNNPIMYNDPLGNKIVPEEVTYNYANIPVSRGVRDMAAWEAMEMSSDYQQFMTNMSGGGGDGTPGSADAAKQAAIQARDEAGQTAGAINWMQVAQQGGGVSYVWNPRGGGQITKDEWVKLSGGSANDPRIGPSTWFYAGAWERVGSANQGGMNGLSVLRYSVYNGNGTGGLYINLGFNYSGSGLTNFNFVQTIRTNKPLGGARSPYNDPQPPDDNLPFYWTNAELPGETNQNGFNVLFSDRPSRG
jgi:RHS repeat-associated protein